MNDDSPGSQDANDELRQTQQDIVREERLAAGRMVSKTAHDINNAISPVALCAEALLASDPTLSVRARKYLTTIQHSVQDVAKSVGRMVEFYRSRKPQLVLSLVDINRAVEEVLQGTRARWGEGPEQRGIVIDLKRELAPSLPAIIGVESEIRDALIHLVHNAVDAMPKGGTMTLRTRAIDTALSTENVAVPRQVEVEVIDTGVGMTEVTRRNCLEQLLMTKGERGAGPGLAIVYGTAQRHGADIEIDSVPGRGTTMRLLFAVSAKAPEIPAADNGPPPGPSRLRLLVVDDDAVLLEALREALSRDGHDVVAAAGGQAGIDAFVAAQATTGPFAAVITDLGMPHVDGRGVARAVRAAAPQTPVFLLTGWGQHLQADDAILAYVQGVLSKPSTLAELREALASVEPPPADVPKSP